MALLSPQCDDTLGMNDQKGQEVEAGHGGRADGEGQAPGDAKPPQSPQQLGPEPEVQVH